MTTTITQQNFETMQYKLLLTVSRFGKMINPEKWNVQLSIYDFENEIVIDKIFNYLMNEYNKELNQTISKFKK